MFDSWHSGEVAGGMYGKNYAGRVPEFLRHAADVPPTGGASASGARHGVQGSLPPAHGRGRSKRPQGVAEGPVQHVWVHDEADPGTVVPGLLLQWRHADALGWLGKVAVAVVGEREPSIIIAWVPADRLVPVRAQKPT